MKRNKMKERKFTIVLLKTGISKPKNRRVVVERLCYEKIVILSIFKV